MAVDDHAPLGGSQGPLDDSVEADGFEASRRMARSKLGPTAAGVSIAQAGAFFAGPPATRGLLDRVYWGLDTDRGGSTASCS